MDYYFNPSWGGKLKQITNKNIILQLKGKKLIEGQVVAVYDQHSGMAIKLKVKTVKEDKILFELED